MARASARDARILRGRARRAAWASLLVLPAPAAVAFSRRTFRDARASGPCSAPRAAVRRHLAPAPSSVPEIAGPFAFAALAPFWQREPVVLRQAFAAKDGPLEDPWPYFTWDDILRLAMADDTGESARLIRHTPGQLDSFDLELGPLDKSITRAFSRTRGRDEDSGIKQTILVNDVDRYMPRLADWMDECFLHTPRNSGSAVPQEPFGLPRWRRDDAQVSLAHAGGGIGPHVDQYDVLLAQVGGRREWRIDAGRRLSAREEAERLIPEINVRILQEPAGEPSERTYSRIVLEAGDCLYLPPRVAHWGTAVSDNCITLSVGFRAPSASDLVAQVAEAMAQCLSESANRRYTDASIQENTSSERQSSPSLDVSVKDRMKALVLDAVHEIMDDDLAWDAIVGKLVTRPLRYSEYFDMVDGAKAKKTLNRVARGEGTLRRAPGVSFATSRIEMTDDDYTDRLFAAGQCWEVANDSHALKVFTCLENGGCVSAELLEPASTQMRQVLEGLFIEGIINFYR